MTCTTTRWGVGHGWLAHTKLAAARSSVGGTAAGPPNGCSARQATVPTAIATTVATTGVASTVI